jgi:hypothetical protein
MIRCEYSILVLTLALLLVTVMAHVKHNCIHNEFAITQDVLCGTIDAKTGIYRTVLDISVPIQIKITNIFHHNNLLTITVGTKNVTCPQNQSYMRFTFSGSLGGYVDCPIDGYNLFCGSFKVPNYNHYSGHTDESDDDNSNLTCGWSTDSAFGAPEPIVNVTYNSNNIVFDITMRNNLMNPSITHYLQLDRLQNGMKNDTLYEVLLRSTGEYRVYIP